MRRFKTGTVAKQVGISPALLRMWESRYGLVTPSRGSGGQRMYSEDDVRVLAALRVLVDQGHSIGELAAWPRKDVLEAGRVHASSAIAELRPGPESHPPAAGRPAMRPSALNGPVLAALEKDGRIGVISPNVEGLLGWPSGVLIGQPIWGLVADVAPALERLVTGADPPRKPSVFWTWFRTRGGELAPCRVACGSPRRTAESSTLTLSISGLATEGDEGLSRLLGRVERASVLRYTGSAEDLLREHVIAAVEERGAALARAWLHEPGDGSLRLVASAGLSKAVATSSRARIRLASYPFKVGAVARSGIPYIHNGLADDRDFDARWIRREKLESAAVLPLVRDGRLLGVTAQFFRRRLGAEDLALLQAAAEVCDSKLSQLHASER